MALHVDGNDTAAQVTIVGGGPVGMALAIELGLRGVETVVVEKHPRPQPVPKGQNLTQRTMEHFHFWGIENELRAARTIPKEYGIGGLTAYGDLLSGYHYDWLQRELVRPYYHTENERLPQYETERVLREKVATLRSVRVLYGWDCEGVEQDTQGTLARIRERETGAVQSVRSLYLVGSDGSRSLVRECAGITQTRSDHDRRMVLLVFRSSGLHDLLKRYPGKSFYNVLHPDLEGYWQFFGRVDLGNSWFFHAPVPDGATKDDFDFEGYLQKAVGAPFDIAFEHIGFWDLRVAMADCYRAGRVFVAGDAAHSHPPYGGYGINTGFDDACNLGWKLDACLRGWGGHRLLESYDEERRPVFASTAKDFIEKAIRSDRDFLKEFDPERDRERFEVEWNARASGARDEVASYEPNYEGSSIVAGGQGSPSALGAHSFAARPGHHLAPKPLSSGRSVYDLLGRTFALIALEDVDGHAARFVAAARECGMPVDLIADDAGGERDAYKARYILVRPDQYVCWAGDVLPENVAGVVAQVAGQD